MGIDVARTGIDVEALKRRFYPGPDHRHQQGDARVATETDAARDRVLEARAVARRGAGGPRGLGSRGGRHPGEDQAQPGQGGCRRRWCGVPRPRRSRSGSTAPGRRAVTGEPEPLPPSMLPEEIDKTLRAARATTADKVRGALERDFTAYAKKRDKDRSGSCALCSCCRSLGRCCRRPQRQRATRLLSTDDEGFQARLRSFVIARSGGTTEIHEPARPTGGTVMERAADTDAAKDQAERQGQRPRTRLAPDPADASGRR